MSYLLTPMLLLVGRRNDPLDQFWTEYEQRDEYLPLTLRKIVVDGDETPADLRQKIHTGIEQLQQRCGHSLNLLLLLTDIEAVQRIAVRLKLSRRNPTVVMRWWDHPAVVKKTNRDILVFNRYTGINFLRSLADHDASRTPGKGEVMLDNPVLLDQPVLFGEHSAFVTMRHTLQALTQPSRVDGFGRRRRNFSNLRLTVATHFYCNQRDIGTVTAMLDHYAALPPDLLDRIQFVLVDDGSPIRYAIPDYDLNLTWLRIDQDIRWNQAGARNLALLQARCNSVVISDIDHLFPEHTLRYLVGRRAPHRRFYKFYRHLPDGSLIKGHPNIFYLARSRFFELFGVDEEFSGAYGAEDYRFVKTLKNHGTVQSHLPKRYHCIERKLDRAQSYHSLVRDLSLNTGIDTRKRMEIDYFGADFGHSRGGLNFTWSILQDKERAPALVPQLDKFWRLRWWFRQLPSALFPG